MFLNLREERMQQLNKVQVYQIHRHYYKSYIL